MNVYSQGQALTSEELDQFVDALKTDSKGNVAIAYLSCMLGSVDEDSTDTLKVKDAEKRIKEREAFVRFMLGGIDDEVISVKELKQRMIEWRVPSLKSHKGETIKRPCKNVPIRRRVRAWWKVLGPEIVFMLLLCLIQLAFGVQFFLLYALDAQSMKAFGWGVPIAKFCAGASYPTLFMLLLSMSRWLATALRHFRFLSRCLNTDYAKTFHILMACEVLVLATGHATSHLVGTFDHAQRRKNQWAVNAMFKTFHFYQYEDFIGAMPGITGLIALPLLYVMALLGIPVVRRTSYELFQLGHLLMFPFIALLMMHGTARLLQFPLLGIVLAAPTALILAERLTRIVRSFRLLDAQLSIIDNETVQISCEIPASRWWPYHAGQYAFLLVPQLSRFQWHPFTISMCTKREIHLHIKVSGDWTKSLRNLAREGVDTWIKVGIDGPYGAPAQRFYQFDQAIIVGAGIGVTPFSAILNDLQVRENHRWSERQNVHRHKHSRISSLSLPYTTFDSVQQYKARERLAFQLANRSGLPPTPKSTPTEHDSPLQPLTYFDPSVSALLSPPILACESQAYPPWTILARDIFPDDSSIVATLQRKPPFIVGGIGEMVDVGLNKACVNLNHYRRVDLHWIVRDRAHLSWFSDLLNTVSENIDDQRHRHLDIRIHNHVTRTQTTVPTYVFGWLSEQLRVMNSTFRSPLTGLVAPTHFGRPNFTSILESHYHDMIKLFQAHPDRRRRVGVFYCGNPVIGAQLADLCHLLTLRGRQDGTHIKYYFQSEVFS